MLALTRISRQEEKKYITKLKGLSRLYEAIRTMMPL